MATTAGSTTLVDDCPICFLPLSNAGQRCCSLACGHILHHYCLAKLLDFDVNRARNAGSKCPTCRALINLDR